MVSRIFIKIHVSVESRKYASLFLIHLQLKSYEDAAAGL